MIRLLPSCKDAAKVTNRLNERAILRSKGLRAGHGARDMAAHPARALHAGCRRRARVDLLAVRLRRRRRAQRQGVRLAGHQPGRQAAPEREPKVAERAPLVVPPDSAKLPRPGLRAGRRPIRPGRTIRSSQAAAAQERERLHLAYCRGDMQWKDRALTRIGDAPDRSPYGPCPTIFGGVTTQRNNN